MNEVDQKRGFLIWPDDVIDELVGDDTYVSKVAGIYLALVVNGIPLSGGGDPRWSQVLDVSINEHGAVTVYTNGIAPHEHHIDRDAVKPLTDWLREQDAAE
jgi:hypothetical protein